MQRACLQLVEPFVERLSTMARSNSRSRWPTTRMNAPTHLSVELLRRAVELWPYVFLAISVGGFAYIAVNAAR
jgi:Uncharacterized conserved protein